MRVLLSAAMAALLLAACGKSGDEGGLEILTGNPPTELTQLDLGEARLKARHYLQWNLQVRSRTRKTVTLKARLEDPVPSGVSVSLTGSEPILGGSTADLRLSLWCADQVGEYEGALVLYCDELPDWSHRYRYFGSVVDRAEEGRHLEIRPGGFDFGDCEPGQELAFELTVTSVGTEPVTIQDWRYEDRRRLRLEGASPTGALETGAEVKLKGVIVAPESPGVFREGLRIVTDADRRPERQILFGGRVVPEYSIIPDRLVIPGAFAINQPKYRGRVTAREGSKPFRVVRIEGGERFFETVSLGGEEPAAKQEVEVRLLKTAPLGRHPIKLTVHLEPVEEVLDWHIDLKVVGAIQAAPDSLQIGRILKDQAKSYQVRLLSFTGRPFEVTSVTARQGYFIAEPRKTGGGWVIVVGPAPGLSLKTPYRDYIEIETDDPDMPKIVVEAYVEFVG